MIRTAANDWYKTRKLGDDITLISEPFIKPFYRCNIWHLRGRDLLIDRGMAWSSLRTHVPLVTEKPLTAVASHSHFIILAATTSLKLAAPIGMKPIC